MKNSLSSYVRNTAFRPAGLSRGSSSSEAFWNAPFSLSNSSIFSPVNCWNTRGFVLASSYFIFFPPLPSFYSLLHAFPIDSEGQQVEVVNAAEELLLKARTVSSRVEERVRRVMERHALLPPHLKRGRPPGGAEEG